MFLPVSGLRAQDDRYRVEVLVLQHLEHAEEPADVRHIRDYSAALDFLAPPLPEDPGDPEGTEVLEAGSAAESPDCVTREQLALEAAAEALPAERLPAERPAASPEAAVEAPAAGTETGTGAGTAADEGEAEAIDPHAVVHVETMGPEMQDAWRRLRLSGPFRPLQYLAWEQGRDEPFPVLRLHDAQVVLTDDPYADLRAEQAMLLETYAEPAEFTGDGRLICPEPPDDPLPGPTLHYALDGTVSLVRTRFLHLKLDLQLREAVFDPSPLAPEAGAAQAPTPSTYRVFALEQSRQVRSGRMEYFDGPVIGVLAWITGIALEEPAENE